MHDLSASIVVYKSNLKMLSEAISSFLGATAVSKLYIIDNSPTNEVKNLINDPRIEYTFNNKNVGFGAGHNIALKKALKAGVLYHIAINPDVYFDKHSIKKLYDFMESNQEVGLCMPKVLYPDGRLQPLCKLLPTPKILITRRFLFFLNEFLAKQNYHYELQFSGYNKMMDVPFLSGCFMFLRMESLKKIGLFDERIFLYSEDVDLSRRIHKPYRTVFNPDVTIYHYHQRGSYKNRLLLLHNIRSAIRYFNKWGWLFDKERDLINQRTLVRIANGI
ncbi:MAG TPA: glycosyl transferase family 2 [Saprospirales bacterium]|nr:glycosyl transferase family 2 [Saprospirales bacterium]